MAARRPERGLPLIVYVPVSDGAAIAALPRDLVQPVLPLTGLDFLQAKAAVDQKDQPRLKLVGDHLVETCRACQSARVPAADYVFSRSERRVLARNGDLLFYPGFSACRPA